MQRKVRNLLFRHGAGAWALGEAIFALVLNVIALQVHHQPVIRGALVALALAAFGLMIVHSIIVIRARQWDGAFSVLSVFFIFLLSQIVSAIILVQYGLLHGQSSNDALQSLNDSVSGQFIYVLFAEAFTLGMVYGYLKIFRIKLLEIGLRKPRWTDPAYGLMLVIPYFLAYGIVVAVVSHFVPALNVDQQQDIGFTSVDGAWQLIMTYIALAVLPPITEEILVRGLLYSSLKRILPLASAAVTTSLLFAAAHLDEGGDAGPLYIAAIDTFVLSIALIFLRERTKGIWASMTLHAIKNSIAFVALYASHFRL